MRGGIMTYPTQFRYTKEHEWVSLEGNKLRIGITKHAQAELGDIVFVELPALEAQLEKGDPLATLESVKAVSDVYAPISGKVVEVNEGLEDSPETVNEDPHGKGWLVVIEVASPTQVDSLLDAAAYEKYLSSE